MPEQSTEPQTEAGAAGDILTGDHPVRAVGSVGVTLTRLRNSGSFEAIQPVLPQLTLSILLGGRSRPWRDLGDGFAIPKGAEGYRHQGGGIVTPHDTEVAWRVEGTHDCLILAFPAEPTRRMLEALLPQGLATLDRLTDRVVSDPVVAAVSRGLWEGPEDELGRFQADHAVALVLARLAGQARAEDGRGAVPEAKERLSPANLRRAMAFLQASIASDPRLEEIAAAVGLSPWHFLRAFKASTGRTPFQWLQDLRVERARGLLAASDLPLAELALEMGFKTQSHFTLVFRRATGTTPAKWRAERRHQIFASA
jgi:AraC family transcriptional regulator